MTEVTPEALREYREAAEATRHEPLSAEASRPARAKVLSIRLNPEEFEALNRHAEQLELPASTLVRGWILTQLRAGTETSPAATVRGNPWLGGLAFSSRGPGVEELR